HNLLTSGDGSASLKWGSTNAYTEDAAGHPVYDWKIIDRIFDTFHDAGLKPLVEIGFMPEALSTHPQPYRHNFPNGSIYTGWAYPPKDYARWAELVFRFVKHLRERYGDAEVKTWLWEVWNEPDIPYWQGTPEEFFKLYDYSVDRKSTRLNSSHRTISYAVFCLKKKKQTKFRVGLENVWLLRRRPSLAAEDGDLQDLHSFPTPRSSHLISRARASTAITLLAVVS